MQAKQQEEQESPNRNLRLSDTVYLKVKRDGIFGIIIITGMLFIALWKGWEHISLWYCVIAIVLYFIAILTLTNYLEHLENKYEKLVRITDPDQVNDALPKNHPNTKENREHAQREIETEYGFARRFLIGSHIAFCLLTAFFYFLPYGNVSIEMGQFVACVAAGLAIPFVLTKTDVTVRR